MTDTIPKDLQRLVKLSSSWRKILLIIAIPAVLIGIVLLLQGRVGATAGSLAVGGLFGYLALKPKNASKSKAVRVLAERPSELSRVSVLKQSGLGAKSAQIYLYADRKGPEASLLVDDVRKLDEALSIIAHHAPQATVEQEETRLRV